ncbi:hypothetical protein D8674_023238 [Pyrus ussuriensis x Pyrus communis]|uniref:Uncharacterized protein n=1 Tax=Pyrus ussuriensis x Pyrus communis TaxID=2448454 RepID=A0A5N5GTY9_9ROSA|nr:hypothetical protein D8674_023238 [Pyrus ussuriensis x Pyrus communis]
MVPGSNSHIQDLQGLRANAIRRLKMKLGNGQVNIFQFPRTGNNNYLETLFKGNHYPYGKDFPGQIPTGRFSSGKLVPDFLASTLIINQAVPAFLDPNLSDNHPITGVCWIWKNVNSSAASYWLPSIPKRATANQQVSPLYEDQSKRLSYASLPCLPIQVTVKFGNTNKRRCSLLPGSKFAYADVYEPSIDMINNPQKFGSCGTGFVEAAYQYLSKYLEKNVLPKLAYRNQSQPLITRSDHAYRADDRYW